MLQIPARKYMQVIMKNSLGLMLTASIVLLAVLEFAHAGGRLDAGCQGMTGARDGVQYCQAPLYALLANPGTYDGKKVATFGYLLNEGEGGGALGTSPDAMRRFDFISCVAVTPRTAEGDVELSSLRSGIHFVMVDGTFQKGAVNGGCVGAISNAHVSRVSKVNERDVD